MEPRIISTNEWDKSKWDDISKQLRERIPILITDVDVEEPNQNIYKNKNYISYINEPRQSKDLNFRYIVSLI